MRGDKIRKSIADNNKMVIFCFLLLYFDLFEVIVKQIHKKQTIKEYFL